MRTRDYDPKKLSTKTYNKLRYTNNTNKPCFTLIGQKYYFDPAFIKQLDIMFMDTKLCEMSAKQRKAWDTYVEAVESGSFDTMTEQLDEVLGLIDYSTTPEGNV
jgi:hypothetical protein